MLAHLYRGEVYRSTIWRTRLDQTTNWAVVTTGLAMSLTFSGPYASPLPLILVGLLVVGLPAARVAALSLLQRLAGALPADGDRRLRPDAARRGRAPRRQVEHAARRGLRPAALPRQLLAGDRAAAALELRLYPRDPGDRLLRQARDPSAAGRHLVDLRRPRRGRAGAGVDRGAVRRRLPRLVDRRSPGTTLRVEKRHRRSAHLHRRCDGRRAVCDDPTAAERERARRGRGDPRERPASRRRRGLSGSGAGRPRRRRRRCRRRAPGCRTRGRPRPRPGAPGWSCRRPGSRPRPGSGRR